MNVEMFGGINMNITMGGKGKQGKKPVTNESPSANSDDILAYAHNIYDKQITLLKSRLSKAEGKEHHISSFQAFAVSLASRVGTGNLAGVATAITVGGPGAVFWNV